MDDESLAVEEIMAVGPGGHHLARPYTRRHTRDFWLPQVFIRAMHDRWQSQGGLTLKERLGRRVAALRAEPPAFALASDQRRALELLLRDARIVREASL